MTDDAGLLAGVRVLDLSIWRPGPYATQLLAEIGADVIKVERTTGDWARPLGGPFDHGDGPLFMGMNRNKRSIAIDVTQPQGREIVQRLSAEIVKLLALPDVKQRLNDLGLDPAGSTPEQLAAFVQSEIAKWGKVIRDSGIKSE